jgi:hypothetical protein
VLAQLPLHPDDLAEHGGSPQATVEAMIQRTVERMYTESEENRFLEVTYANGDKEVLYFKDFNSGAMIENIVARAKKMAIKEFLGTGQTGRRAGSATCRLRASTSTTRTRTCVTDFDQVIPDMLDWWEFGAEPAARPPTRTTGPACPP